METAEKLFLTIFLISVVMGLWSGNCADERQTREIESLKARVQMLEWKAND